jgi:hypothetical protein
LRCCKSGTPHPRICTDPKTRVSADALDEAVREEIRPPLTNGDYCWAGGDANSVRGDETKNSATRKVRADGFLHGTCQGHMEFVARFLKD